MKGISEKVLKAKRDFLKNLVIINKTKDTLIEDDLDTFAMMLANALDSSVDKKPESEEESRRLIHRLYNYTRINHQFYLRREQYKDSEEIESLHSIFLLSDASFMDSIPDNIDRCMIIYFAKRPLEYNSDDSVNKYVFGSIIFTSGSLTDYYKIS